MSKPGFCVTEDASIKVGVRLGQGLEDPRAYIPNPVMLHATRAPTTSVAAPNERSRENIPAPTMDPTTVAVSANNDSRRPVSDMVAPSRFAGGILRAWCSRKLYAAGTKGHPANAANGRTIGAGQRPNGRRVGLADRDTTGHFSRHKQTPVSHPNLLLVNFMHIIATNDIDYANS